MCPSCLLFLKPPNSIIPCLKQTQQEEAKV
jgi:hypothetical protein